MTSAGDDWADPLDGEYELRVTRRARADLRVPDHLAADLTGMQQASPWGHLIGKFAELRARDPAGTEAPLSKVHRNDIFKLDGRGGERAVTWHDTTHGVVWLLAFTPEHDYDLMVRRAGTPNKRGRDGTTQLMPTAEDYEELSDDRGDTWAQQRALDALQVLVGVSCEHPDVVRRASLAGVVRAEALVASGAPRRLHLRFRVPRCGSACCTRTSTGGCPPRCQGSTTARSRSRRSPARLTPQRLPSAASCGSAQRRGEWLRCRSPAASSRPGPREVSLATLAKWGAQLGKSG